MTLKTYELPYGDTVKTVALPEDEVIAEVRTKSFTPIPKEAVKSKILEAIRNPIGIGPLDERVKPGDTVCLSVTTSPASRIRSTSCRCSWMN